MPIDEIVRMVESETIRVVSISIAPTMDTKQVTDDLHALRAFINKETEIAIGGKGAPENLKDINRFESFTDYYQWLGNNC
jgi:hypothetical protein